jgi:hypothetical protein
MSLMDPVTHKVRLNSEQCATCLGNPKAGVVLRPGRLRELIRANTGDGKMGLVCHMTIVYDEDGEPSGGDQALCRWFYDSFGHLVNGIRVMLRMGGFTEVRPPRKEGTPAVPAEQLSERESAALRIICRATDGQGLMATGPNLAGIMKAEFALDTSPQGAHQTAASLVRKGLAQRAGTTKLRWYKMTQTGRSALDGNQAGRWVAR